MSKHYVSMPSRQLAVELKILQKICQEINSPRSLAVYLLSTNGEFDQLVNLDINPQHYDNPRLFADDYLCTEMLKKSKVLPLSIDREAVAFSKWVSAEHHCRDTNEVLESFRCGLLQPPKPHVVEILARAMSFSRKTLGSLTKGSLERIYNRCDFGPGVTTGVKGDITRGRKFSNRTLTTTRQLLDFGLFCLPDLWKETVHGFEIRDYNQLSFVPKNSKVDRAITVENDLNIFVQKGIGQLIKQRLLNISIDTANQWQVNRHLVSISHEMDLCTIDLSSASDTLSVKCVQLFVPDDWFELLCWTRPEFTLYKGELIELNKFAGMGCGFTFELETLIFHSVLVACKAYRGSASPISTFGDDMVCGIDIMDDVIDTLKFLGFKVNHEKTFGKGSFHESCGVDYFVNQNVRPFYLRRDSHKDDYVQTLYQYCNLIRRYASHRNGGDSCDSRFLPAWLFCFSNIPKSLRNFVPDFGYECEGVVGNLDEAAPSWTRPNRDIGYAGYGFTVYSRTSVTTQRFTLGAYIGSLHTMTSFTHGREAIRGRLSRAKKLRGYTLSWVNLGPWI